MDLYAEHCAKRLRHSPNTIHSRLYWLDRFDRRAPLTTASPDDVWDFLEAYPDWSESTTAVLLSALHGFYAWAIAKAHLVESPVAEIAVPRVRRRRSRIATDDALVTALEHVSTIERAMLLLGAECGLRVSEIATVRRADRDGEWLFIRGKGDRTRVVHLTPELCKAMDAIERDTMRWGFYFPSPRHVGRHLTANAVYCRVRKLTGYNTHALRHRAGTMVYRRAGNDLRLAQEFLGHSSPTTTAIYVHVERDDMRRASAAARLAG
ncbi:tyrosine-type recombinase/integrase [Curtobacterium sp. Csp2]|nr:tyrosine-type recombinase/integrase [Curtobacterium sp. Csp2]